MKRIKYKTATVGAGATGEINSLNGESGKSIVVTSVNFDVLDKLLFRVWKNQILIAEGNTGHYLKTYGSATLYRGEIDLEEPLSTGDILSVQFVNGTGGGVTDGEVGIAYTE